ncbi:hypothetical protein L2E82_07950 [Cichorium intybus]|uniref:Uncharacterized protein n=1 Tax=Cichorium intybus TaxID=13427 RepID=A0ACB9G727_CICIN|nr:hypothetical protein L2E82_07950 [Cichorium intybus]
MTSFKRSQPFLLLTCLFSCLRGMELWALFCVLGVAAIMIWTISNWLWFKPKKIEKFLRDQGLKGSPYRFGLGDLKEMVQMSSEAKSKPMNLTHDIAPRVLPFFHKSVASHVLIDCVSFVLRGWEQNLWS